ncbi:hypothetical protein D3C78_1875640 [compost metagenome]
MSDRVTKVLIDVRIVNEIDFAIVEHLCNNSFLQKSDADRVSWSEYIRGLRSML